MRRCRRSRHRRAGAPRSSSPNAATERRPPPTSSIVPTSTRIMLRMKASASIPNSSSPRLRPAPRRGEHDALEAHVIGLSGGERGEVVLAHHQLGALPQCPEIKRVGPVQRPSALEGAARGARQDAVGVAAAGGVASGIEARRGGDALDHGHVVGQQRVDRVGAGRLARVAGDLATRVHARVGAPGDGQAHYVAAQHHAQRPLQLTPERYGAARLARPARQNSVPSYSISRRETSTAPAPSRRPPLRPSPGELGPDQLEQDHLGRSPDRRGLRSC